jgi:rRNA maturation endonuclease Nob1
VIVLIAEAKEQLYKKSEYLIAVFLVGICVYLIRFTDESLVTIASLLFSGVLALLYTVQAKNQRTQTQIMEKQYQPELLFSIEYKDAINAELVLKNVGDAPALGVNAEWSFKGEDKEWKKPIVESGDTHHFPIMVEDGWVVNSSQLKEKLDGEMLEYVVTCENVLGETKVFDGKIDVEEMISGRGGGSEMNRETPVEQLTDEVSDLVDETEKIGKLSKEIRKDLKLNLQSGAAERINDILESEDSLNLLELQRKLGATGVSTSQVRNYVRNLESSGVIELEHEEDIDLFHNPREVTIITKNKE